MRVLVRADAGAELGAGHLMRCLALAQALRARGAEVSFACRPLPGFAPAMVTGQGFALHLLEGAAEHPPAPAQPYHWAVVDHYGLGAEWEAQARAYAGRVLAIDDLADRAHACDGLLDHNLSASAERYAPWLPASAEGLFGPRYALLRPIFSQGPRPLAERVGRVLVNFGGFDAAGMALRAVQALQAWPDLAVEVVAGRGNPALATLQALLRGRPGSECVEVCPELGERMARADLIVGAGGGSSLERAALGVPSLCVAVADNQVVAATRLAEAGAHLYLGEAAHLQPGQLEGALGLLLANAPLRRSLAARGLELVDGQGTARVARWLFASTLRLRPAVGDDAQLLFDGRNAAAVRAASLNPAPLSWPMHQAWLAATLQDPHRALLVAEAGDGPVGSVRLDRQAPGEAEISLYLFEARLGQGWGGALLAAAHAWLAAQWPDVLRLNAQVLPGNGASQRLFRQAGYRALPQHFQFDREP